LRREGSKAIETLNDRLTALLASRREIAVWNAAYEQCIEQLAANGFLTQVLAEGAVFPDFMLPSAEGGVDRSGARARPRPGRDLLFSWRMVSVL
jgi:hypothetical protein